MPSHLFNFGLINFYIQPVIGPDKLVHPEITEKPPQEEAEKAEVAVSPRGRRKGLERKRERPRFSLIPNSNNSSVNLEPALDLDKLKDPEEFFLAFERLENAKREIAKQTGRVSGDFSQNNGSTMAPRPRRQGLPGRSRTAKYQHLYPTVSSQESIRQGLPGRSRTAKYQHLYPTVSSQESIEEDPLNPSDHGLQKENVNQDDVLQEKEVVASQQGEAEIFASEDMEQAGSILLAEGRVDKLLDGLLSHDFDDLDEDGTLHLLQDRLQIRSLEIGNLNLPDIQDVQRIDLKAPRMNVPKPRNVLLDINNLLKGRSEIPMKQKGPGSSSRSLCSPILPKSPFASLSLLKKRLFQSNPSDDPFSSADIDESPARNTSLFENIKKSSDPVDTEKELIISSPLKSTIIENEMTSSKDTKTDMTTDGIDQNLVQSDTLADARTTGPNEMEDIVENMQQDAAGTSQLVPDDGDDSLIHPDTDADFQTRGSTGVADMEAAAWSQPCSMMWKSTENQFEQSDHPLVEDYATDGCFEIQDDGPQQTTDISPTQIQETASELHNEKNKEPSVVSKEGQVKEKSQSRKKKELSSRQSLAAAGTTWTSEGVRRSTRIRSRPLEYWRGERFLYGRIHESLATVIGIKKYKTPKKDRKDVGNADIIVESFVSDKYQNLVKLAALN